MTDQSKSQNEVILQNTVDADSVPFGYTVLYADVAPPPLIDAYSETQAVSAAIPDVPSINQDTILVTYNYLPDGTVLADVEFDIIESANSTDYEVRYGSV